MYKSYFSIFRYHYVLWPLWNIFQQILPLKNIWASFDLPHRWVNYWSELLFSCKIKFFLHCMFPLSSCSCNDMILGVAYFGYNVQRECRQGEEYLQVYRIVGGGRSFRTQSMPLNIQICWNNLSSRYGWKTLCLYLVLCTHFIHFIVRINP